MECKESSLVEQKVHAKNMHLPGSKFAISKRKQRIWLRAG